MTKEDERLLKTILEAIMDWDERSKTSDRRRITNIDTIPEIQDGEILFERSTGDYTLTLKKL
jgi:hypothetical protein